MTEFRKLAIKATKEIAPRTYVKAANISETSACFSMRFSESPAIFVAEFSALSPVFMATIEVIAPRIKMRKAFRLVTSDFAKIPIRV